MISFVSMYLKVSSGLRTISVATMFPKYPATKGFRGASLSRKEKSLSRISSLANMQSYTALMSEAKTCKLCGAHILRDDSGSKAAPFAGMKRIKSEQVGVVNAGR